MLDDTRSGRHRTVARYNPLTEISTIVKGVRETGLKAYAVLAASGGLVAAFALPAQASPVRPAAPSSSTATAGSGTTRAAPAALAPAVVAPRAAAPIAVEAVGVVGVKAVAKPKPKPKPAPDPVVRAVANRSSDSSRPSRATTKRTTTKRTTAKRTTAKRTSTRYTSAKQSASGVVNIARTLLGIPYVYGGSSPSGFDCSGFTQYVFRKAGVSVPRTASAQQRAATPVSSPKPGDLVFFGSPAWHVGIYTGPGMMIDSPKPGKSTSERDIFSGVSGYGRF